MLTIQGNTIHLTRGDTAYIEVPIELVLSGEREPYTIQEDDILYFTVRKHEYSEDWLIRKKVVGTNIFHIEPIDTKSMKFDKYLYDVELNTSNGDVFTVIEASYFFVDIEVS